MFDEVLTIYIKVVKPAYCLMKKQSAHVQEEAYACCSPMHELLLIIPHNPQILWLPPSKNQANSQKDVVLLTSSFLALFLYLFYKK